MVIETGQYERTSIYLNEAPRVVRFTETETRMVVRRPGKQNGQFYCIMGSGAPVIGDGSGRRVVVMLVPE